MHRYSHVQKEHYLFPTVKLFIKNMACVRCSLVVQSELKKLGLPFSPLSTGEIEIDEETYQGGREEVQTAIRDLGLEMVDDRENILIEKIKAEIIRLVSEADSYNKIKISDHLTASLGYSYHYLSTLFSTVHGTSIERFYISHRIDRVKEMLVHGKLTFSEIAYRMNFSSVAHLSSQFKKETGFTLSRYREIQQEKRGPNSDR